MTFKKYFEECS